MASNLVVSDMGAIMNLATGRQQAASANMVKRKREVKELHACMHIGDREAPDVRAKGLIRKMKPNVWCKNVTRFQELLGELTYFFPKYYAIHEKEITRLFKANKELKKCISDTLWSECREQAEAYKAGHELFEASQQAQAEPAAMNPMAYETKRKTRSVSLQTAAMVVVQKQVRVKQGVIRSSTKKKPAPLAVRARGRARIVQKAACDKKKSKKKKEGGTISVLWALDALCEAVLAHNEGATNSDRLDRLVALLQELLPLCDNALWPKAKVKPYCHVCHRRCYIVVHHVEADGWEEGICTVCYEIVTAKEVLQGYVRLILLDQKQINILLQVLEVLRSLFETYLRPVPIKPTVERRNRQGLSAQLDLCKFLLHEDTIVAGSSVGEGKYRDEVRKFVGHNRELTVEDARRVLDYNRDNHGALHLSCESLMPYAKDGVNPVFAALRLQEKSQPLDLINPDNANIVLMTTNPDVNGDVETVMDSGAERGTGFHLDCGDAKNDMLLQPGDSKDTVASRWFFVHVTAMPMAQQYLRQHKFPKKEGATEIGSKPLLTWEQMEALAKWAEESNLGDKIFFLDQRYGDRVIVKSGWMHCVRNKLQSVKVARDDMLDDSLPWIAVAFRQRAVFSMVDQPNDAVEFEWIAVKKLLDYARKVLPR